MVSFGLSDTAASCLERIQSMRSAKRHFGGFLNWGPDWGRSGLSPQRNPVQAGQLHAASLDWSNQQYAMANLPAIAEGPTADEQMLMAEASSVSRQTDLETLRHDKREFIKVCRPECTGSGSSDGVDHSCDEIVTLCHGQKQRNVWLLQANRRALAKSPKFGETFGKVQSSDLPPQFRAILEDNRVCISACACL